MVNNRAPKPVPPEQCMRLLTAPEANNHGMDSDRPAARTTGPQKRKSGQPGHRQIIIPLEVRGLWPDPSRRTC